MDENKINTIKETLKEIEPLKDKLQQGDSTLEDRQKLAELCMLMAAFFAPEK